MKASFPPYAFVPGHWPHPRRDADGHSFGQPEDTPPPMQPGSWQQCPSYLRGIELLNHGYYWEAHEAWEGLWIAAKEAQARGESGHDTTVELLQGLIKLAAAGVKVRQQMPEAAESLAGSSAQHFEKCASLGHTRCIAGLAVPRLIEFARSVAAHGHELEADASVPVQVVFAEKLTPDVEEKHGDRTS